MFRRATIRLGIGPHSSLMCFLHRALQIERRRNKHELRSAEKRRSVVSQKRIGFISSSCCLKIQNSFLLGVELICVCCMRTVDNLNVFGSLRENTRARSIITFCVSRSRRKMYCGHARLCVCLSVCLCVCVSVRGRMPTLLHRLRCNLGEW